eukprot:7620751-Pyramimonas_sp.AAC.1
MADALLLWVDPSAPSAGLAFGLLVAELLRPLGAPEIPPLAVLADADVRHVTDTALRRVHVRPYAAVERHCERRRLGQAGGLHDGGRDRIAPLEVVRHRSDKR